MTWNIEGIRRNIYSLKHFAEKENPDLIFLIQIFQFDIKQIMDLLKGEYSFIVNSEDTLGPELGLIQNRAKGGTMILWKRSLEPTWLPSLCPHLIVSTNFWKTT